MDSDLDVHIADLCRGQHGAVSRAQLLLAGIGRNAIRRRITAGTLIEWSGDVLLHAGAPATPLQTVMATVLDAGPGACASHDTTLHLAGVPGFSATPVHITQPRGGVLRPDGAAIMHTSRRIALDHVALIHGIPSTTVTRALFDIAATAHPDRLDRAVDAAWTRSLTDHRRLCEALDLLARQGRAGIRAMREAIEQRGADHVAPESGLEHRFHQMVEQDGQPPLLRQVRWHTAIGEVRFDAFDPEARVDAEMDSALHHRSLSDMAYDERRDAAVRDTDVVVARFSDDEIWNRPRDAARRLREVRRAGRARWSGRSASDSHPFW